VPVRCLYTCLIFRGHFTLVMCEKQENRFKDLGDLASAGNNRAFWNRNSTFVLKVGRLLREFAGLVRSTAVIKRLTTK
ncbi:MAG TPA: hypothetical protein PKC17_09625, partial [Geobacter anodireducens]|nr:hypothetical protein [Geobacter anodireducens]